MRILSIDIGGSGLKASVIDHTGKMLTQRQRIETPHPCPPAVLLREVLALVNSAYGLKRAEGAKVGAAGAGRRAVARHDRGRQAGDRA